MSEGKYAEPAREFVGASGEFVRARAARAAMAPFLSLLPPHFRPRPAFFRQMLLLRAACMAHPSRVTFARDVQTRFATAWSTAAAKRCEITAEYRAPRSVR